jgi:hypothetical protein
MLSRTARYWLCCTAFNTEEIVAELGKIEARVQLAPRPTSQYGPYDYIFIESSEGDQLLDLALEDLLGKLEPNISVLSKWGDPLTSGIEVMVRTSEKRYGEAVSSDVLARLAKLNMEVSFVYECMPHDA